MGKYKMRQMECFIFFLYLFTTRQGNAFGSEWSVTDKKKRDQMLTINCCIKLMPL